MSFMSWLRNLRSAVALGRAPGTPRRQRSLRLTPHRPGLEVLEDRCTPSTFTVLNLLDSGAGSLRAAVAAANANPGADTIDFAVTGTIGLTSGQLDITDSLTINGPGAGALTVSSHYRGLVFDVAASTIDVNIHDLTIADSGGSNIGIIVGAIYNAGTLTVSNCTLSGNYGAYGVVGAGGAIYNGGTLTVNNSTLSDNVSTYGGGIYNGGTLTVSNSTFYGNEADGVSLSNGNDASSANGGAIFSTGTLTVSNSTISNNFSIGSSYYVPDPFEPYFYTIMNTDATGGGLYVFAGTASIDHSTIAGNRATGQWFYEGTGYGGGIAVNNNGSQLQLYDSILADNSADHGPDLYGGVTSLGHNLIGNSNGSGFAVSDLLNVDPRLGPLQDNGGPTQTMALLYGSPALDAGDGTAAPAYDQRGPGFARIVGGTIDIGAFEAQSPPAPQASSFVVSGFPSSTTAGMAGSFTVTAKY